MNFRRVVSAILGVVFSVVRYRCLLILGDAVLSDCRLNFPCSAFRNEIRLWAPIVREKSVKRILAQQRPRGGCKKSGFVLRSVERE
ncbi:hypothetical protein BDD12DRAFT_869098 [Trichophaea hybrida]|nr:hypothetical protein BDD12DRAFT_869098 [Trichophaea hybrida]